MISLRVRTPAAASAASVPSRSSTAKHTWLNPSRARSDSSETAANRGLVEPEELDLLMGGRPGQGHGDVVGLPVGDAHVAGHGLTGHDGGRRFLEPEQPEEPLGLLEVGHRDGDMVESAVHRSPLGHRPAPSGRGSTLLIGRTAGPTGPAAAGATSPASAIDTDHRQTADHDGGQYRRQRCPRVRRTRTVGGVAASVGPGRCSTVVDGRVVAAAPVDEAAKATT